MPAGAFHASRRISCRQAAAERQTAPLPDERFDVLVDGAEIFLERRRRKDLDEIQTGFRGRIGCVLPSAAMDTPEEVLRALTELSERTWALNAVSAVAESGMLAALEADSPRSAAEIGAAHGVPPSVAERLLDVVAALGLAVREGDRFRAAPGLRALLSRGAAVLSADLRTTRLQGAHLVDAARRGALASGWRDDDRELVAAQGILSSAIFEPVRQRLLPQLEGLSERLAAPGAAMLDIGAGAAGGSIAFCQVSPTVRVVALEPAAVPLEEARRNIAAAGLGDRIELREQRIEDLTDVDAFDAAWLPQMFLPTDVLERALATVRRALRPGGWLLTASISRSGPDLRAALSRLRDTMWGGTARMVDELVERVRAAGFDPVRALTVPGAVVQQPIAARKPV
jgi:SAM-dependent methyltransferase